MAVGWYVDCLERSPELGVYIQTFKYGFESQVHKLLPEVHSLRANGGGTSVLFAHNESKMQEQKEVNGQDVFLVQEACDLAEFNYAELGGF